MQPSPVATASSFFHTTVETFDRTFTLMFTILPGHVGTNRFTMQVTDHAGRPAERVKITLYTTMQDMSMGTDSVVLHPDGPGQFSATSDVLNMGGHWAIGIAVQTADQSIHKAGVMLAIPL
jgi:nitrogen fixation protein FixH